MREIKFRAWDQEHKKIIYEIDLGTINFYGSLNKFFENTVLMQYTGLKDKNGKDIYEGDIVQLVDFSDRYEIAYGNGAFYQDGIGDSTHDVGFGFQESEKIIVIGNIYENPELLKP